MYIGNSYCCYYCRLLWLLFTTVIYCTVCWPYKPCQSPCKCYKNIENLKIINCSANKLVKFPNISSFPLDVNVIDLSNNFIQNFPTDNSFQQFHELIILDVSNNYLTSINAINNDALSTLKANHNYITELNGIAVDNIPGIRYLDLSYNKIANIQPTTFQRLKFLWHLDISNNRLTTLPLLHQLQRLIELNLSNNLLESVAKKRLNLPRLLRLNLSKNRIRFLEDMAFSGCPLLRSLNLSGNQLSHVPCHALFYNGLLSQIDIHNNPIEAVREGDFVALPHLREIHLSRTRIEFVEEGGFENLPSLVQLSLNDNPRLTFIDPESFKNLPALNTLFLHNSNLSTIHNITEQLPALQNLALYGNPLVCDCNLKWLKESILSDSSRRLNSLLCYSSSSNKTEFVRSVHFDDECSPRIVRCPSMVELYEGQFLKLSCQAIGSPVPETEWYSPESELISRSDFMVIESVNKVHQGVYEFLAKSSRGTVRQRIQIKVNVRITLGTETVLSNTAVLKWSESVNKFVEFKIWSPKQQLWGVIAPLQRRTLLIDGLHPSTAYKACLIDDQFTLGCTSFSTLPIYYWHSHLLKLGFLLMLSALATLFSVTVTVHIAKKLKLLLYRFRSKVNDCNEYYLIKPTKLNAL